MSKAEPTYPNMNYVDEILKDVTDIKQSFEWGEVIELSDKAGDSFPTGKFPDWIEDYVNEVSSAVQSPKDMSYALAIGVLSTALTKRFKVNLSNAQTVHLNSYTVVIADSGERKSATFDPFIEPVHLFEKELQKDMKEQISRREAYRKSLEIKRKAVETLISKQYDGKAKTDKNKVAELTEELNEIIYELSDHPPIATPMITIGDTTPEKFAKILHDQNETISIASAESTFFSDFAGAYNSNTPRQELILGAYSGDPHKVSRVNEQSDGIVLDKPLANVLVMVQPAVLETINPALKGRGLLNRFFYYKPASMVGYRKIEDRDIDETVKARYFNNVYQMLRLKQDDKALRLSSEAKKVYQSFATNTEHDLREGNVLHDIQGWANRLSTSVVKIAGLMHVAENIATPTEIPTEINAETMLKAIDLSSYMVNQMKSVTQLMEVDEVHRIAKNFVDKIKNNKKFKGKSEIPARELKGSVNWQGAADGAIKDEALRILAEHNYIRTFKGGKNGTKAMIEVNPALLGGV